MRSGLLTILFTGYLLLVSAKAQTQPDPNQGQQPIADSAGVMAMVERADSLTKAGKIKESIALLERSQQEANSLGNSFLIQSVNIQRAYSFLSGSQPDSAEQVVKKMLEKYPDSDLKDRFLNLLGTSYRYQGKYEEALERHEQAKALIDSASHPEKISKVNQNIGSVHSETGNYGTAFKYFLRSIETAESIGDSLQLATGLNSIGLAYNNNAKYEDAKHHLQRAIKINKRINNKVGLLRATNNIAISYQNLENLDQAISAFNRALELHGEVRKDVPPFRILYNLGQLYKNKGSLDQAIDYYNQSLKYCKQAGIPQGIIYNYGGLANVAELRGDFSQARRKYQKALEVAQNIGMTRLEKEAYQSLYKLEKNQHNYRQALDYHEKLTILTDSLDKIAREQQIEETETKLGLRRQEEINRLLEEKQAQQEARITTQNWLIAVGMVVIVVILGLLYLLYQSYIQKKQINSELESQRNRLEELNKVKDKILAVIAHDLRSPMASMQGMLYMLKEDELSQNEIKEMATELNMAISQNISMMDNMLAWAREQMSGLELDITRVDAHETAEEVIANFELQSREKEITITNEMPEGLQVMADPNLLRLIFRNLVSNSIKFSHPGDEVILRSRMSESGTITFEVSDTGIGIPAENQEALFSIEGASRSGTKDEKGSGLGLQLCKEFVEKQNGEINVESTEGEGTSFYFSLPKV